MSNATWNALAQYYDTHEMMNVLMTVASYRLVSISLNAFGVQPKPRDELFSTLASQ